jgi:O-antigen/teichoic acid export membrane protein
VLVWVHQYLLRRISAEEYQVYPVVMAVLVLAPLATSVLTAGIGRYVVSAFARGERETVTRIVSSVFPPNTALALLFLALGLLLAWFVGDVLTVAPDRVGDARLMLVLLLVGHTFRVILLPFSIGLYVRQKFVWINLLQVGKGFLRIAILFTLLFGVSTRVLWVVVATTAADFVETILLLVFSVRLVPDLRFRPSLYDGKTARSLTSFGLWNLFGYLAYHLRTSAPALILNKLGTAVDVASFHVGSMPDRQLHGLTRAASEPAQPMLTAMDSTGDEAGLRSAYFRGNRYYLWATLCPVVPLIVFAREIVVLYVGRTYLPAAAVILYLYLSYPFMHSTAMLYRIAVAQARIRRFMLWALVAQAANVLISIYCVAALGLGAAGPAIGTLVTAVLLHVLVYWPVGLRMVDASFREFASETLLPGLLPAAATAGACLGLRSIVAPSSWTIFAAWMAVAVAVYATVLFGLCTRPGDREFIGKLVGRARRRFGAGAG